MTDLIERELTLPAAPAAVWEAVTDPAWLREWLADDAELDLRPGGEARFTFGDEVRAGWVEEVTPPDETAERAGRLAFWWEQDGEPATRVQFELTATDDGTRLRVVESRPLDVLDLVGIPLGGARGLGTPGADRHGPALVAG